jgi:predicted MPP superfamily phosphohydrolase
MKLRSSGRGRRYSALRGLAEAAQAVAYVGAWPARVLDRWWPPRLQVVTHSLSARRAGRQALRVAFASDLHIGPITSPALLDAAFAQLAAWAPDVLILGGDYVFLEATPAVAARLEALVGRVGAATKLAVLGNHDLWTDHGLLEAALERGGARVLVNQGLRLPPPHDDVAVVGLDDPWSGAPDADRAFADAGVMDATVRIAAVHAPEGQPHVSGRGAALMLCGHTHGGQIATPRGPIVVHGPLGRRWPAGLYRIDELAMFVSRGLGTVELPLRLFAPPDVALFTIT